MLARLALMRTLHVSPGVIPKAEGSEQVTLASGPITGGCFWMIGSIPPVCLDVLDLI